MRRIAGLLTTVVLLSGCGDTPAVPTTNNATGAALQPDAASLIKRPESEARALLALRAATDPFHRIEAAVKAGFNTQAPPGCFASAAGGMGFHWNNAVNVGTLDPAKPQFVMYEPQQDGSMKLVGAEFIFPGSPTDAPPVLFGQKFTYNTTFQVWALHVWIWEENPSGLYADWNPRVSCAFAKTAVMTKHH
ncbi:MAG TPA: hypothetical protein VGP25_19945 [Gemmatimonadaceae bacterium]|jgi:hypothetical protein|nr:hypothetical protein [Gemmatimonadaceae bacterium]